MQQDKTTADKKEAIAAAIQAAKTIVDLLFDSGYVDDSYLYQKCIDFLWALRDESQKLGGE